MKTRKFALIGTFLLIVVFITTKVESQTCPSPLTISSAIEGNFNSNGVPPGTTIYGGFHVSIQTGSHPSIVVEATAITVTYLTLCPNGTAAYITIPISPQTFIIPAGSTNWYPSNDPAALINFQGHVVAPNLCGGQTLNAAAGAVFNASFYSTALTSYTVKVQFHYGYPVDNSTSHGWSATTFTSPNCMPPGTCNTVVDCGIPLNPCQYYTCESNFCILNNISGCCTSNSQCNDGNICTTDTCDFNRCNHTNVTNCCVTREDCINANEVCFDDFCNTTINQCYELSNQTCCDDDNNCAAFANACQIGSCNLTSNTCSFTNISGCCLIDSDCPSSGPCSTGKCNTTLHRCEATTNIPGCCVTNLVCDALAGPCQITHCNTSISQCYFINVSNCCTNDTTCDDDEFCTVDTCNTSVKQCVHTYTPGCCSANYTCTNPDVCTVASCNISTHNCTYALTSPLCNVSDNFVVPIADCILNVSNGTLLARFAYDNFFWTTINITAGGPRNYFTPPPPNLGQPSLFLPGMHSFLVPLNVPDLVWTIQYPDDFSRIASLNESITPFCGTYCNTEADCLSLNQHCLPATCQNNVCIIEPLNCTTGEPCVTTSYCDPNIDQCVHVPYSCDDGNPCTVDNCRNVNNDPVCSHILVQDCVVPINNQSCPNCNHTVSLTIDDCAQLTVTSTSSSSWKICHTSLYRGPLSAVIIDFFPYSNCSISNQGSCSNHYAYPSLGDSRCVMPSVGVNGSCGVQHTGVAFTLPGISNNLQWDQSIVASTLDQDDGIYLRLIGNTYDPTNSSLKFQVDIVFNQYVSGLPGIRSFLPTCYTSGGGFIDVSDWQFFINAYGTIIAEFGTPYYGLQLAVHSYSYTQLGVGANNVNTNNGLYGQFFYTIIRQAYDPLYQLPAPPNNTYGTIWMDVTVYPCQINTTYCDKYQEPQIVPANGWGVSFNSSYITYCRDFTLDELVTCNQFEDITDVPFALLTDINNVNIYSGYIYVTTVLPVYCFLDVNTTQCFEEQVQHIKYPINISLTTNGTDSVDYTVSQVVIGASWIYNIWLIGSDIGDLEVIFRTCVEEIPDGSNFTQLQEGIVLQNRSTTPIQFHFVDSNVECDPNSPFPYCCQTWGVRTFGANTINITDFSGVIAVQFDVVVDGICREDITIYLDLHAKNEGHGTELSGQMCTTLSLYRDRYFQVQYVQDPRHPLVECDPLYAVLAFCDGDIEFDLEVRKASVCYLSNGDISFFDPLNPSTTGCNTPGAFRRLIFSEDVLDGPFIDPTAKFMFLSYPPAGEDKEAFVFTVRPYTRYRQILQVDWYALDMSSGNVLVEQITEYELGDGHFFIDRSEIDEDFEDFYVRRCVFSDPKDRCHERDIDIPLEIDFDDDDDDDDEDSFEDRIHDLRHRLRHERDDEDDENEDVVIIRHRKENEEDNGPSTTSLAIIAVAIVLLLLLFFSLCVFLGFLPSSWRRTGKRPVRHTMTRRDEYSSSGTVIYSSSNSNQTLSKRNKLVIPTSTELFSE